jgi:hypothetical protein
VGELTHSVLLRASGGFVDSIHLEGFEVCCRGSTPDGPEIVMLQCQQRSDAGGWIGAEHLAEQVLSHQRQSAPNASTQSLNHGTTHPPKSFRQSGVFSAPRPVDTSR